MDERQTPTPFPPASGDPARVRYQRTPYQRQRKHMGVATNDPEYLPPVDNPYARAQQGRETPVPRGQVHISSTGPGLRVRSQGRPQGNGTGQLGKRRLLSTTKKNKAIFTSRQAQQQRRVQILLAILIALAVVLALVWWFLLR